MVETKKTTSPHLRAATRGEAVPVDLEAEYTLSPVKPQPFTGNSAFSQRSRILYHLRHVGPLTTLEAHYHLDIMRLAARIKELRKAGYPIITVRVDDQTPEGRWHPVARYFLKKERQLRLPGKEEVRRCSHE